MAGNANSGRLPKPTALKLLTGNPGKHKLNLAEPVPPPPRNKCPDFVSKAGRPYWRKWYPIQAAMRVMTSADEVALGMLSDAMGEYVESRKVVEKLGQVYTVTSIQMSEDGNTFEKITHHQRPEVRIAQDAWKRIRAGMQDFGMTPASRSRLSVKAPAEDMGSLLD